MAKFRRNHVPTNNYSKRVIIFLLLILFLTAAIIYLTSFLS